MIPILSVILNVPPVPHFFLRYPESSARNSSEAGSRSITVTSLPPRCFFSSRKMALIVDVSGDVFCLLQVQATRSFLQREQVLLSSGFVE